MGNSLQSRRFGQMTALLHMNLSDLEKSPTIMFQSQLQMEALYY